MRNLRKGPEKTRLEKDPVEKELELEVTHWKRGRCGRMCCHTCPIDAPGQ